MSQKNPSDGAHKGFAVGRGLLAAAETLNFSMSGSRPLYGAPSRPSYGMSSALGSGDNKNRNSQLPLRGGGGGHVSNTMKLFDSLGLSPTDIDALAQIPEENISIETLPQLIMQLKNRKMEAGRRMGGGSRDLPPISPDHSYRASRDDWEDLPAGRMGTSPGQVSARGPQMDYGYGSMQGGPSRGYKGIDCGENSGGGMGRDRQYSELSRERFGGLGMGPSPASDSGFLQKRMGSPSKGKVQDFLGVMPHMFPHVCALCDFDVHSMMEWNQHTNGLCHAENRRQLVQMYPDWDPHMESNRGSGSHVLDSTNRSDGILGPAPMGPPRGGMNSNWGSGMSNQKHPLLSTPKMRPRIVVAETDGKPIILNKLLSLAQPFGAVRQHLVRMNKAYLEMQSHEEAAAMVNCYQEKPPMMHGRPISLSLSWEHFPFDKGNRDGGRQSRVVFFSNLPREREKKHELLTVARRFGTVEKYLFLNEQAFVQLGTPEDAEMMVKYYTLHPLTIKGRSVRLNICEKYKTLIVNPARHTAEREDTNRKSSGSNRKGSPKRTKSKVESAKKEGEVEDEDSALLEEGSGEEIAGVIEADEGDPGEAAETQEAEPADIPDEAMIEEGEESSTKKEEADPDGDEAGNTGEESGEVPATERSKEATGDEPPSEGQTEQADGESPPDEEGAQGNVPSTDPTEKTEMAKEEPEEDPELPMEQDFPEDMEDFVTLDEVAEEEDGDGLDPHSKSGDADSESSARNEGLKVVRVVGLKRGYNFLDEILALAKPFGKVVRYLVLDTRPEAFLELSSEEEARAMVSFYRSNVTPTVCGRPVKVYHSQTHSSIHSGRVVYVGHISLKTSDAALLKIAEPYGKVKRYYLNRPRCECFIEMEKGQDAERMARAYKENPPRLHDQRLTVYVSRKYKQLRNGLRPPPPEPEEERPVKRERDEGSPAKNKAKKEGEPPAKKICIKEEKITPAEPTSSTKEEETADTEEPSSDGEQHPQEEEEKGASETPCEQEDLAAETENEDVNPSQPSDSTDTQEKDTEGDCEGKAAVTPSCGASEETCESEEAPSTKLQAEKKPAPTTLPLGPYQPNNPVGVEFVKMGYYCRVCFLFYSNEETAKKVHCSSLSHFQKLKKHLQKEKGKEKEKPKSQ